MVRYIIAVLVGLSCISCGHLYYYPKDQYIRLTPDKVHIPYEAIKVSASDGTELVGWYLKGGNDSIGTVLHLHGNAQNMSTHMWFVGWLARAGFDVIVFDYRGYGLSKGDPDREGTVRDAQAFLRWIRKHPKLGKQDLFVFGQSLGGSVAIPAITDGGQEGVTALIVESSFSSYRRLARDKLGSFWLTWAFQWPLSFLVGDTWAPDEYVSEIKVPTLYIYGTNDPVVPYWMGQELYKKTKSEKTFWKIENGGHISAFANETTPYKPRLVAYLCEHLKKASPTEKARYCR